MRTDELDYNLPEELIAQRPCERRDASRLMVVFRETGHIQLDHYRNIARYLHAGDCMALNNTRVIRARLHGRKQTGGKVEVFLLRETAPGCWTALVRPAAKVKPGCPVRFGAGLSAVIDLRLDANQWQVRFNVSDVIRHLETSGEIPLPPYIKRSAPEDADARRYQTIYASTLGAVAAPTAGLHLTEEVFASLDAKGVSRCFLTLHVGYGTFKPITVDKVEAHVVDGEEYELSDATAHALNAARQQGGRVVAVGTTCARALETQYRDDAFQPGAGVTNLYIYPPYTFHAVDALQTNFHLPKSSLLALVCAFAGKELVMGAYECAIKERFRFYSYGDAMLIL